MLASQTLGSTSSENTFSLKLPSYSTPSFTQCPRLLKLFLQICSHFSISPPPLSSLDHVQQNANPLSPSPSASLSYRCSMLTQQTPISQPAMFPRFAEITRENSQLERFAKCIVSILADTCSRAHHLRNNDPNVFFLILTLTLTLTLSSHHLHNNIFIMPHSLQRKPMPLSGISLRFPICLCLYLPFLP